MHPTESALLAAVLANPADDLPRLVLADWLEENGQAERAMTIRDSKPRWFEVGPNGQVFNEGEAIPAETLAEWFRLFDGWGSDHWAEGTRVKVRHGFISEVWCELRLWAVVNAIGPAVVRSHPVERVVLTDVEPLEISDGTYEWHRGSGAPHYIPNEIYSLINAADGVIGKAAAGREAATSALSDALIAWAKSQPTSARIDATPISVDITSA